MAARDQRSLLKRFTTNTYVAGALPTIGGIMFGCDMCVTLVLATVGRRGLSRGGGAD